MYYMARVVFTNMYDEVFMFGRPPPFHPADAGCALVRADMLFAMPVFHGTPTLTEWAL